MVSDVPIALRIMVLMTQITMGWTVKYYMMMVVESVILDQ